MSARRHGSRDLFDDKAFPGGPHYRVALQVPRSSQTQQSVDQATVTQVDLGRLHQPFADVRLVRLQAAHQQGVHQMVDITRHGGVGHAAQRLPQLRGVQQLPLQVREHGDESAHGLFRHTDAQCRQVALQQRAQEGLSPTQRRLVVCCQKAQREATSLPQLLQRGEIGWRLACEKGRQLFIRDAPGQ